MRGGRKRNTWKSGELRLRVMREVMTPPPKMLSMEVSLREGLGGSGSKEVSKFMTKGDGLWSENLVAGGLGGEESEGVALGEESNLGDDGTGSSFEREDCRDEDLGEEGVVEKEGIFGAYM